MIMKHGSRTMDKMIAFAIVLGLLLNVFMSPMFVVAAPEGAQISFNTTETKNATPAASLVTAGGTFTTMLLNGTMQTPRWKAYVGNVSGSLTLDDSTGKTIYDWSLLSISGEVYASRSNSIAWGNVNCTTNAIMSQEETALNISVANSDSINRTFNTTVHKNFYVGSRYIMHSSCPAISTYVNDSKQASSESALFQEVLLADGTNMVYSTILEQGQQGFDQGRYNFQLIVPENEYASSPTPYYFYLELS